jgi:hypothetical protein
MKNIITMWHKDYKCDVEVYDIITNDNKSIYAICFIPVLAGQQNGQGWLTVKMNKLIPYPHAETYKTGMSKTEKNKIKSMLKLTYSEWTCTDGNVFNDVEEAICHQRKLIENGEKE